MRSPQERSSFIVKAQDNSLPCRLEHDVVREDRLLCSGDRHARPACTPQTVGRVSGISTRGSCPSTSPRPCTRTCTRTCVQETQDTHDS